MRTLSDLSDTIILRGWVYRLEYDPEDLRVTTNETLVARTWRAEIISFNTQRIMTEGQSPIEALNRAYEGMIAAQDLTAS